MRPYDPPDVITGAERPRRVGRTATVAVLASVAGFVLGLGLVGGVYGVRAALRRAPAAVSARSSAPTAGGDCAWRASPGDRPGGPLPPVGSVAHTGTRTMTIHTGLGPIVVTMSVAATPCTVASFSHLAARHFFDHSRCHRLTTKGIFVLQCGDPTGTGSGGPGYRFPDENLTALPVDPSASPDAGGPVATYRRGVVATANAGPGTNGSQFFLVYRDSPIPARYTPFGVVDQGMDVLDRIAAAGVSRDAGGFDGPPATPVDVVSLAVG